MTRYIRINKIQTFLQKKKIKGLFAKKHVMSLNMDFRSVHDENLNYYCKKQARKNEI